MAESYRCVSSQDNINPNGSMQAAVRPREPTRQDMREYTVKLAALNLDLADRKVVRIAGW